MQGKCPVTKSHIPAFHYITTFHCLEQQSMNMGVKTNFVTVVIKNIVLNVTFLSYMCWSYYYYY